MDRKVPDFRKIADDPVYNTKAAVQLSGVPAPTLRAWERRYHILNPERAFNTYRLYSERDIAKIRWLQTQVEQGLAISRAADILEKSLHEPEGAADTEAPEAFEPRLHLPPVADPGDLSLVSLNARLLEAFCRLDEAAAEKVMNTTLAAYGVEDFCTHLIEPVMTEIGLRWEQDKLSVTVEHFASALVRSQLTSILKNSPLTEEMPLVLAGCAPGEYHEIGLLIIALFLRRHGLHVVYLGQSLEIEDLLATVRQTRPEMVTVSLSTTEGLGGLVEISRRLAELPDEERPVFSFGGRFFKTHPELAYRLHGFYLGNCAAEAVEKVRELARHNFSQD